MTNADQYNHSNSTLGGLQELQSTTQWKDAFALRKVAEKLDVKTVPSDLVTEVLRLLHPSKAADLAVNGWPIPGPSESHTGQMTYLIEAHDLRSFYGPTIGLIAHSHWWPTSKVEHEFNRYLGAMSPKTGHTVDLLKIAGLLRVGDAIHLDRRRAPPFVRALDRPAGLSALHWDFQARLAFPHLQGDAIVFTAGEACPASGADGWWLAYDALNLADRELRDTDLMFGEHGRPGLRAKLMQPIVDSDGIVHGRAALYPSYGAFDEGGVLTSGGMRIQSIPHIVGVMLGDVTTAARTTGSASLPLEALARWASLQAKILRTLPLNDALKARSAEVILECGGAIGQLPIAQYDNSWLTPKDIARRVSSEVEIRIHLGEVEHDDEDNVGKNAFEMDFEPLGDIYFIPALYQRLMAQGESRFGARASHLITEFEKILRKAWGSFEEDYDEAIVGEVNGEEIIRSVAVYSRAQ